MDINITLLTSLRKLAQQHTDQTLGDRNSYLGASDIGYCPRKVILERVNPGEHDLASLLRFQRGHMAEDIVANAFTAAGYTNFQQQVEVDIYNNGVPVKVHVDFAFTSETRKIKSILEVKSTSRIPDGPYGSWESQLYLQMGALAREYPEYTIKGAILPLDLANGEVELFNGYTPEDTIFNGLLERAGNIWSDYQAVRSGEEVDLQTEVTALCGCCNHITTCPRFEAQVVPEMAGIVDELQGLKQRAKKLEESIQPYQKNLLAVVEQKGPIQAGGCILRKVTRSRKFFAMDRLESFLSDHGRTVEEFQETSSFSFLEIKKAKKVAN